ncbi:uncharacterized protein LOC116206738 [Punica granatum]|uniref:Uncharacterized protein LOC116206738 n=1 Tax=Punica granatum TaxID=22663 RepID=A0A6P8DFN8_PUNGR|nr:uncharacterized protein LOC116206738 [Punica granatum]
MAQGNLFMVVSVYVDDIVVGGNYSSQCQYFKRYLNQCFRIKDLGSVWFFLDIEVTKMSSGLFLNQKKYILDILTEYEMLGAKPLAFPMEQNHRLIADFGLAIADPSQYRIHIRTTERLTIRVLRYLK